MLLPACGILLLSVVIADSEPSLDYTNFYNVKDEGYQQPVNFMAPKRVPHMKAPEAVERPYVGAWAPLDLTSDTAGSEDAPDHNRLKRRAKRRRNRNQRRHGKNSTPSNEQPNGSSTSEAPQGRRSRKYKKMLSKKNNPLYDNFDPPNAHEKENGPFVEMPKDLYQSHLRPGVIFRIHMSEAVLKMQYRNYGEDKDESVIEADVEYLRLTRKVINDEITKFEDLRWLVGWFTNRSTLIQEHTCNTMYYAVGTPPTIWTHQEEYMKRMCLFDNVYIDHIPYVIGEDNSLMAAVAPPVLHCDASTCTSVPFIDSLMFDEKLPRSNVRTMTRCQAGCRGHCRNDPDCLKRCSDRCLRAD